MSAIPEDAIKAVEKEIMDNDKLIEERISKEVDARLAKIEADKQAKIAEEQKVAAESAKETELKTKLAEMEANQKELQKQLENISLRKSIPKEMEQVEKKLEWKDLSAEEKIRMQKEYVSKVTGMLI